MERHGFIHDMMDIKVLVLYVMARVAYPVDSSQIYELCLQDDCVSYFDIMEAIPQMVSSGHLAKDADGRYAITQKGKEAGALVEDSLAYPVAQRAKAAVEEFNRATRRDNLIATQVVPQPTGEFTVQMSLDDEKSNLFRLEVMATSQQHARRLADAFHKSAELVYRRVMETLLEAAEGKKRETESE